MKCVVYYIKFTVILARIKFTLTYLINKPYHLLMVGRIIKAQKDQSYHKYHTVIPWLTWFPFSIIRICITLIFDLRHDS